MSTHIYGLGQSTYKVGAEVLINRNPNAVQYAGIAQNTPGKIISIAGHFDEAGQLVVNDDVGTDYCITVKFQDASGNTLQDELKPSHMTAPRLPINAMA